MDYTVCMYNQINNMDRGLFLYEMCKGSRYLLTNENISGYHNLVCPEYVLDTNIHKYGFNITKWNPRAKVRHHMGYSHIHSYMVWILLNLRSGSITPQYHVMYDYMLT